MSEYLESMRGRPVVANVSGGKDSTALSLYLTENGIEHRRVFADTGWEHPDTYAYLDRLEARIGKIDRVSGLLPMAGLIRKKGMFPGRLHRYCTSELKVKPINRFMDEIDPDCNAVVALGIRAEESRARAGLPELELAGAGLDRMTWRPLIGWTFADVVEIHARHGIEPNPLYLRGASRVGCWPCIYARKAELRMVAEETPERIDEIRAIEAEFASKPKPPTYFSRGTIDECATWARTDHGSDQLTIGGLDPDAGCMRWGLCDSVDEVKS